MATKCPQLVRASERPDAVRFQHPPNPNSEIHGHLLGRLVGLKRSGVKLAHVPPGKESFVYHSHEAEEEWICILAGRGVAEIDSFGEELVYLTGGESREVEIADYPRLGLRMLRTAQGTAVARVADLSPIG
jgi:uncharacterized cupin superfamily protein